MAVAQSKRHYQPQRVSFQKPVYNSVRALPSSSARLHLPIHTKRKMSSASTPAASKRSGAEQSSGHRPSKLQKLDDSAIHGLEAFGVQEMTGRCHRPTTITTSRGERYRLRKQVVTKRVLANTVKSSWKRMPSSAQKGLKNPGVLCYRNSLLQALLHSPKFTNWLVDFHPPKDCLDDQKDCVACQLRKLAQVYWKGSSQDVSQALSEINTVFRKNRWVATYDDPNGQGDPEEHYTWMMKQLSEKLPSHIYNLFEATSTMLTRSCIKCAHCDNLSVTEDHSTGPVSVPLRPRIVNGDLSDYLEDYMEESISGYKCEKCHVKDDIQRYQEITHSPDTLLVQLKRFDYDGRKDSFPVSFKANLDLNVYRAETNKDNSMYDLSAVILHWGSLNGGHYRCVAKGEDGQWHNFDDSRKSKITLEEVLDKRGGGSGWTPYLLFFQRRSD